jgi:hypothetical protein
MATNYGFARDVAGFDSVKVKGVRPTGLLPIAALVLAVSACRVPGGVDGGPPPAFCTAPTPGMLDGAPPEAPTTLTMVIGTDDPTQRHVAKPWNDGDHVPLVAGGQGGFMIRPSFDVTAPAALPEDDAHKTCLGVSMIAGPPATTISLTDGVLATRIDGTTATYHVPALLGLLSYNSGIDGMTQPLALYMRAADPKSDGYQALSVVLDASLSP